MNFSKKEERDIFEHVKGYGQAHVFKWWNELGSESRTRLMRQIQEINFEQLAGLISNLTKEASTEPVQMEPAEYIPLPSDQEMENNRVQAQQIGEKAVQEGKLGVFTVAGGQGTRLGFDGPKGCYPIGPVTQKSIFQLHAEKIAAASRQFDTTIPWYIMTSEANDVATRDFFESHGFFGLNIDDVYFIKQRLLPVVDRTGKLILAKKDSIFMSPNGHGGSFMAMMDGGVIEDAKKRGIEFLSYFQVDNVLIHIVDPVFVGYHLEARSQMSSKMLKKRDSYEKLGHFGKINGRLHVIEYSDMSEADMTARDDNGRLKYEAGSIGIHLIDIDFARHMIETDSSLIYHVANKKIPCIDENGHLVQPDKPNGYKFERFVFDALPEAENPIILETERAGEFSPVKNKKGEDSPDTARQHISNYFGSWLEGAGIEIRRDNKGNVKGNIEISPLYAGSADEFITKVVPGLQFEQSLYLGPSY